jgi:predicted P-loop ATPase
MPEQSARYEADPWEELIEAWLRQRDPREVTLSSVARDALQIETSRLGRADQNRIAVSVMMVTLLVHSRGHAHAREGNGGLVAMPSSPRMGWPLVQVVGPCPDRAQS